MILAQRMINTKGRAATHHQCTALVYSAVMRIFCMPRDVNGGVSRLEVVSLTTSIYKL